MVIASACYITLSRNNCSLPLSRFENMVCRTMKEKKNLFKMIVSLNQYDVNANNPQNLVESSLCGLNLSFQEIQTIKKNIDTLRCQHCSYNPMSVLAGHTYLFLRNTNKEVSIAAISSRVGISKNSIYSYINQDKHKCVKTWYYAFK